MNTIQKFVPGDAKWFANGLDLLSAKLKGTDDLIHELAVTSIYHAQEFGNYAMAGELVTVCFTAKSIRKEALIAWFDKHSNIEINVARNVAESRKNRAPTAKPCDWEAAYGNPFYLDPDLEEQLPQELTYEDSIKKLFGMANSIRRTLAGKTARKASPEDLEKLGILADQIQEMSQVVKSNVDKAVIANHVTEAAAQEAETNLELTPDNTTVTEQPPVAKTA